ncbi:hypothetical protein [Priestia koreensis]|uniref:hypothetical protein n=1 Tax=Priestia koreensis TaxID=284581 RepID=UPI001F59E7F7|nr:hypothetical protein [Priestia koreensis]UNL84701.1 hypothetical protein IE339_21790 [Priestia koreensis]
MDTNFPRIRFRTIFFFLFFLIAINLVLTTPLQWIGINFREAMFVSNSIGGTIAISFTILKMMMKKITVKWTILVLIGSVLVSIGGSYLIVFEN